MKAVNAYMIFSAVSLLGCLVAYGSEGERRRIGGEENRSRNYVMHARYPFASDDMGCLYDSVPTEISYFDGLGRRIQTVRVALDGSRPGVADFVEYDCLGRVAAQWMPTVAPRGSSGAFADMTALGGSYSLYGQTDRNYARTILSYESTPRGRPVETRRPGKAWHSAPRGTVTEYLYSGTSGRLRCHRLLFSGGKIGRKGTWGAGELRVVAQTDEEGNGLLTFTDGAGRTHLRREIPALRDASHTAEYLDTYFVYDIQGRLRAVIPPSSSPVLDRCDPKLPLTDYAMRTYCTIYTYDSLGRLTGVRYPGTSGAETAYTPGGLAMYSDGGEQTAAGKVSYVVYDRHNRVAYCGCDLREGGVPSLRGDSVSLRARTRFIGSGNGENANTLGYLKTVPFETDGGLLRACFYDDYAFLSLFPGSAPALAYSPEEGCDPRGDGVTGTGGFSPKGHLTGTATRIVRPDGSPGEWLVSAFYYDYRGRLVQTRRTNHLGGTDTESLALTFDGRVLRSVARHTSRRRDSAGSLTGDLTASEIRKRHTYDAMLRPLSVFMSADGGPEVETVSYTYDDLGRRTLARSLDGEVATTYGYTPEGLPDSIGNAAFTQRLYYDTRPGGGAGYLNGLVSGQTFSLREARVNPGQGVTAALPASLSASWDYTYSGPRLVSASYAERSRVPAGSRSTDLCPDRVADPDYSELYGYDPSGNLVSLRRKGYRGTTSEDMGLGRYRRVHEFGLVDDLSLEYDGTMLRKVTDLAEDPVVSGTTDFCDGADAATEYTWDLDGRMTSDLNKGIASISYSQETGTPREIRFSDGTVIRYTYDASGTRLATEQGVWQWTVAGGDIVGTSGSGSGTADASGASLAAARPMKVFVVESRRDYCGDVLYADGEIERVRTDCGWYSPGGRYTAVVSDHQGNLRATLTKTYAVSATSGSGARAPSGAGSQTSGAASASVGDVAGTGAAGTAGIGIGGGTIGGGIVIPVDPDASLHYTNLTAYSPYGLPLTDWQGEERYLYSGKELERGKGLMLYDFHARQYDPQLGRFTSPDPLRDDYPGLAPYLYCAANPISLIDPTGRDIYELDNMGYINFVRSSSDVIDILQSSSDESNFIVMEKSFMKSHRQESIISKSISYGCSNATIDYYEGREGLQHVYNFVIANSDVEWSKVDMTSVNGSEKSYFIGTTHQESTDSSQDYFRNKAIELERVIVKAVHNHSPGNRTMSDGDKRLTTKIKADFPNADCYIVFPNNCESPVLLDPNKEANVLEDVYVYPNKELE